MSLPVLLEIFVYDIHVFAKKGEKNKIKSIFLLILILGNSGNVLALKYSSIPYNYANTDTEFQFQVLTVQLSLIFG